MYYVAEQSREQMIKINRISKKFLIRIDIIFRQDKF